MLILKLITVPLFIVLISFVGRKWGSEIAGTLGAFPVVAGPILFFLTLEQGLSFGAKASIFVIYGSVSLLIFGLTYAWVCRFLSYIPCLFISLIAWYVSAFVLSLCPQDLFFSAALSLSLLFVIPYLLPKSNIQNKSLPGIKDLPIRMIVGMLLTISITSLANHLGAIWSGILSVFPVVTLVLVVFAHRSYGQEHVLQVFKGLSRGVYSFVAYFVIYALCIEHLDLWQTLLASLTGSLLVQLFIRIKFLRRQTI
ncbi:hypothetical protein PSHI8_23470 [Polynucleobacter sp. SHI8]|uniref:hypothetical protein n=1 Tax=unclassified Polynucleobacter TaxID=2640945 RepID=UPI0024926B51|nr:MULTISPECIES: hypothetical protein [unclassified Polynucleobacter]BDW12263.1 hypothetical protein PSHI2_23450 [Polynucleobacter sp. SHI2]BDW14711.1 hypothetical protein PSHI8_23470 [Polynucleobacter sp. SHI8]